MSEPIPINAPSKAELWRRNQLALSILGHRTVLPRSTAELLQQALNGELSADPREEG